MGLGTVPPAALPAAWRARLGARLAAAEAPLIQLWGWPASGRGRLLESLLHEAPVPCARIETRGTAAAFRRRLRASPAVWSIASGELGIGHLAAAAEVLEGERRLLFATSQRRLEDVLPLATLPPAELLLRAGELRQMFPRAAGEATLEELLHASDGWLGPLTWLGAGGEPGGRAFAAPELRARFADEVLSHLDADVVELLAECAPLPRLDQQLWRRVWLETPRKLATLELAVRDWGLVLGGESSAAEPPRLPRLLRHALLERRRARQAPGWEGRFYRRLGLAAYALDRRGEAEAYFRLAGDDARSALLAPRAAAAASPASTPRPAAAGTSFRLDDLGHGRIRRLEPGGGDVELRWKLRRAFQIVAYLALAPERRASKDEIVEAIWPEAGSATIRKNFHPTLSAARRTLDGEGRRGSASAIELQQGLYALAPRYAWWVDSQELERRIRDGRKLLARRAESGELSLGEHAVEAWREAWRLYRGPLLEGVEAAWAVARRERLHREVLRMLRQLGDLAATLGRSTLALDAYRSVLLEEPFEEPVHLALMELYAHQGRRDLVRRQYVRLQDLLRDELNVEPSEGTQERYHELMS